MIVKEAMANGRLAAPAANPVLLAYAGEHGVPPDAVAIAAAVMQPWSNVVPSGAVSPEMFAANRRALELVGAGVDPAGELARLAPSPTSTGINAACCHGSRLAGMTDPDALAEALLELTTALTIELHPAIAELAMPGHFEAVVRPPRRSSSSLRRASPPIAAAPPLSPWPPWPSRRRLGQRSGWPMGVATETRFCRRSRWRPSTWWRPAAAVRSGWRRWPAAGCAHRTDAGRRPARSAALARHGRLRAWYPVWERLMSVSSCG